MKETPQEAQARRAAYHLGRKASRHHKDPHGCFGIIMAVFGVIFFGCLLVVFLHASENADAKYQQPTTQAR